MCGIIGILDPARRRGDGEWNELLVAMASTMRRRGPDDDGTWCDPATGIGFGHRRLAVLDLSAHGHQPMVSTNQRYVITYNGEIYNHRDLRSSLEAEGVRFRGHSDTEYLVEAISAWGVERTVDRIDGMFAFGVWDAAERRLVLARDRLGEKPLYYGRLGSGEFVFASSLDAMRAHPAFDCPVDRDALALFFRHKYVPAPATIFRGIAKLEPGHLVSVDIGGEVGTPTAYWSYFDAIGHRGTTGRTRQEAADHLDHLLRRSVQRRLNADVGVGAFLSGGIDSSTIVAIAQQVSKQPVKTFTMGMETSDYDESHDAAAVARHLGTDHTNLVVTAEEALRVVGEVQQMYDEPFADSSQIPTFLVSEMARRDVTVALSGDGGDELFGGYNRYVWVPQIWNRMQALPDAVLAVGVGPARRIPPRAWDSAARILPRRHRPRQVGLKAAKALNVLDARSPEEIFHRVVSHWQDPTGLVVGAEERATLHTCPDDWPAGGIAERMMAVDAVTYLPDDILAKVDRASMAVSLEVRVPFLDRDVVEFAASLPLEWLIEPGRTKAIVRDVLDSYVPHNLIDRPKSGFGVPLESWLRGPLRDWSSERLFGEVARSFLDIALVERAWTDHVTGRRNNAQRLWDVLMFVEWCSGRGITS